MRGSIRRWIAIVCSLMAASPTAYAAEPLPSREKSPIAEMRPADVALRPGGLLVGRVIDTHGLPQANVVVAIGYGEHEVVRTTTDASGVFAAQGLRGGQYQLVTPNGQNTCRLWSDGTAPPSAQPLATVVNGSGDVVRGQFGYGPRGWVDWMRCHPYVTAGAVAGAIAVPLAFADRDFRSGS